jgi:hypothetical protein
MFRAFLVDHHVSLDALEVLDRAPLLSAEPPMYEEPGPVSSQVGVAKGMNNVLIPGHDPGPQGPRMVDRGLLAHLVKKRIGIDAKTRPRQFFPKII